MEEDEWYNQNGVWEYWKETVENRFERVQGSVERIEEAIFGAAGLEPVVLTNIQQRIDIALQQYTENMNIEFEHMQQHFIQMKNASDHEIQILFGQTKQRFDQEINVVVQNVITESQNIEQKLDAFMHAQEKLFEHKLQTSVQIMRNELMDTVEKNVGGVVEHITKILDETRSVGKKQEDISRRLDQLEVTFAHPDPAGVGEGTLQEIMGRVTHLQDNFGRQVVQGLGEVEKKLCATNTDLFSKMATLGTSTQQALTDLSGRQEKIHARIRALEEARMNPTPNPDSHGGRGVQTWI